jgi:hypothetical protein
MIWNAYDNIREDSRWALQAAIFFVSYSMLGRHLSIGRSTMAASMLSFMHSVHGIDLEEREREQGRRRVSSYPEREHVRTFAMLLDIFAMLHHSNKFIPISTAVVLTAIGTDRIAVIAKA